VAGGGPATVRREGKVSSMLHGRRTARGELGQRSPWMKLATSSDGRTVAGFGHGGGTALDSGDGAVGMGRGEASGAFGSGYQNGRDGRRVRAAAVGAAFKPSGAFGHRHP
jgi:hypothetical protein